tara:strand:+ start:1413 stop:1871 length:459 start_codon:yes stop_codon:yes gene_type:complete
MLSKYLYESPVGNIGLLKKDENLIALTFTDTHFKYLKTKIDPQAFKEIITQLNEYFFEGRENFEIEFALSTTKFREKVYKEMMRISYGDSLSYSDLAVKAGSPKAFRAVGTACGKNPLPIIIPCHRVRAKIGLGGFTGGLHIKKFLIMHESN